LSRKFITTGAGLPPLSAPISHAVVAGNYCHVSGQLAINAEGKLIGETTLEQARLAFANVFAVLAAANFTKDEIVFVDIAFLDLKDLPDINRLCDELFDRNRRPARTIYQAADLPLHARVKILAVAIKD